MHYSSLFSHISPDKRSGLIFRQDKQNGQDRGINRSNASNLSA